MEHNYKLTPSALNKYIKNQLEHDKYLVNIYVVGEISNFKSSNNNYFFSLKDSEAQINCVMFKNNATRLSFVPQDGMNVCILASIYHNIKTGYYSLNVYDIQENGIGALQQKYEALLKKLAAQGLFAQEHKQLISGFYNKIALITAPTSAAIKDMISTIKRRNPLAEILIIPTIVQGIYAKDSIVKSIELVNEKQLADIMIVGRGGGSIEDLWAFNEECVAYAVYNSKIPIISCVGHETDTTIIDYVSDKRAATPTAASELVTPNVYEYQKNTINFLKNIKTLVLNKINYAQMQLQHLKENQYLQNPLLNFNMQLEPLNQVLNNYQLLLNTKLKKMEDDSYYLINHFHEKAKNYFQTKYQNLLTLKQQLSLLNPYEIVKRGYAIIKKNDQYLNQFKTLKANDAITICVKDYHINAIITNIKEQDEL